MKEIILLFANTHHSINATILLRFVPKMLDVSGELLVMSLLMELYAWFDCVSFSVYSELAKIKKGKRVWVFLTRFQNVTEVRKFIQCEVRKFTIPL